MKPTSSMADAMMSGKLSAAILNHSLAEPLRPTYSGEGDDRTITLTGRPQDSNEPLSVTAKVRDAKTANEQWKKNPDQMLMYFSARMWGRRYTPDLLLGIVFDDEETADTPPIVTWRIGRAPKSPLASSSQDRQRACRAGCSGRDIGFAGRADDGRV